MGMKPRGRRWRWVTRDGGAGDNRVRVWDSLERPRKSWMFEEWCWVKDAGHTSVCADEFKKLFRVVPRRGQCLKVHFRSAQAGEVFDE